MTKDFFKNKLHPLFLSIETSALDIWQRPVINGKPFNPFKFTNYCLKEGYHIGSVDEALKSLIRNYDFVKNAWAYVLKIVKATSPMYYERQHIDKHIKVKDEFKSFVEGSDRVKDLVQNIGRIWV